MTTDLPADYWERTYAGVLGKIIGVYLGRPVEGWSHERIRERFGTIDYFVADQLGEPLVVTDDDITGTFTFVRALTDAGSGSLVSAAQIGEAWLNYIVEGRAILWWGGLGNSSEHTAYLRLASGIQAPRSGSAALNGRLIAEEIGAQIFIDGWAMVAPGDPALACSLARRAASVSHDGIAVEAAGALAAIEAQAYLEDDIDRLIDAGRRTIPQGSVLGELVDSLRQRHQAEPDWRETRLWLAREYGYQRFPGNVPILPNHGLIILSLLYGAGSFDRTMSIVNTGGWDTDCNSGNLGCLMGIRGGLSAFEETRRDWRGPVEDRLFLPTADGGRAITDALTESLILVNAGRAVQGLDPIVPKGGARFHFEQPGAVQTFRASADQDVTVRLANVAGHSSTGTRSLELHWDAPAGTTTARVRLGASTFKPTDVVASDSYELMASPTLYPGQRVVAHATVEAQLGPTMCRLFARAYGVDDRLIDAASAPVLVTSAMTELAWTVPDLGGGPIVEIGLEATIEGPGRGRIHLDSLGWAGAPDVVLRRPGEPGTMWRQAWVDAVDGWDTSWPEAFRITQDRGQGLLSQGTAEWRDYQVSATLTPWLCRAAGLAARVGGLRRFYALLLADTGELRLEKHAAARTVLAHRSYPWDQGRPTRFSIQVAGPRIRASLDGIVEFEVTDHHAPLLGGGVGLVIVEGRLDADEVVVRPIPEEG